MATKKQAVPVELVRVLALEPVRHDGDDYAPGEVLEVNAADAAALVQAGAAEFALAEAAPK